MCKLCSGVSVWNQGIIEIGGVVLVVLVVLGGSIMELIAKCKKWRWVENDHEMLFLRHTCVWSEYLKSGYIDPTGFHFPICECECV